MSQSKQKEIVIFISGRPESVCDECQEQLGRKAWIQPVDNRAICLSCADLDHLFFLPSGDAALTRRAKKYSKLWAVVVKWSRPRRRYERQGLLVEEEALDRAEQECMSDAEARKERRLRAAEKRAEEDQQFIREFARQIRRLYPACPNEREFTIASHACLKYSGRVGRSATAKRFDADAIRAAVVAHVRHTETEYDRMLTSGRERWEARDEVRQDLERVLQTWAGKV